MPVANPRMKLIVNNLPKNLVRRSHSGLRERIQKVCIRATTSDSPIVIGTKK